MSDTCISLIEELEQWVATVGYYVYVRGVRIKKHDGSNKAWNSAIVSYFYGNLNYQKRGRKFSGNLVQLFSDRVQTGDQPFDINKDDVLGLEVFVDGHIRYTLKSWQDHTGSFQAKCENGLMFGYDQEGLYWVFDFAKLIAEF